MNKAGRTVQGESELPANFYLDDNYFQTDQMMSLVTQIQLVESLRPARMLEIGKGNGFVSDFLRRTGIDVVTFDVNPDLSPDVHGSLLDLDKYFSPGEFDLVLCAQVLEHLPLSSFASAVNGISTVTSRWAVITLPRCQRILLDFQWILRLPRMKVMRNGIFLVLPGSKMDVAHHWEIGSSRESSLQRIVKVFKEYFEINEARRIRLNPYHHYFILEKCRPALSSSTSAT